MSTAARANRRMLWLFVSVAVALFFGSLLFIISRAQ
jgi:hypothetical protein